MGFCSNLTFFQHLVDTIWMRRGKSESRRKHRKMSEDVDCIAKRFQLATTHFLHQKSETPFVSFLRWTVRHKMTQNV